MGTTLTRTVTRAVRSHTILTICLLRIRAMVKTSLCWRLTCQIKLLVYMFGVKNVPLSLRCKYTVFWFKGTLVQGSFLFCCFLYI